MVAEKPGEEPTVRGGVAFIEHGQLRFGTHQRLEGTSIGWGER
jgi:hypothetical protein